MTRNIEQYLTEKYGFPEQRFSFKTKDGKQIQILKWSENQTDEGVTIYCSLGSSKIIGNKYTSCEFFIGISPENDSIIDSLAEVTIEGKGDSSLPNTGDTITLSFPLWKGTNMKTYFFINGEDVIADYIFEDKTIKFIQLIPLYDTELIYKKKFQDKGKQLWNKFEKLEIPYWDSTRNESAEDFVV